MPNTESYTHTHTHEYVDAEGGRCDCGSTKFDTALREQFGIEVVQIPGIGIWTITRFNMGTAAMFTEFDSAMHAANERAREAAAEYMRD